MVELLLEEGASVAIQNDSGRSALHEAAVKVRACALVSRRASAHERVHSQGRVETCLVLMRKGADLLQRDDKGCTPLCRFVQTCMLGWAVR